MRKLLFLILALLIVASFVPIFPSEQASAITTSRLLGDETVYSSQASTTYVRLIRYLASATGILSKIHLYSAVAGNVKVALYADSATSPTNLIVANNTSQACSANQWNNVTLVSASITSGTYYWIGFTFDTNGVIAYNASVTTALVWRQSNTYSTYSFPSTAGDASSWSAVVYPYSVCGYGGNVSAPTVDNNGGASSITTNSARLNGNLTANGGENPTVHIYWGDNDGDTNSTAWDNDVNLGALAVGTFYTDISSLSPNTQYFYRSYATNSGGDDWADSTDNFTTSVDIPTVANLPASSITNETARLNGNVTYTGGENPTTHIYWGLSDEGDNATAWDNDENLGAKPLGTFYSDITSLSYLMTYFYRSFVSNSGGNSWASDTVNFTTLASPPIVENIPASDIAYNSATLNGNLTYTDGENSTVFVYWGTSDGEDNATAWGNEESLGSLGEGVFSQNVSGLSSSTIYFYRCFANNTVGEDWADTTENFTTELAPPTDFVAVVLATDNSSAAWVEVGLTWTPGASLTVILRRFDGFPTSPTDGVLVYNGTGSAVNETITAANIERVYYAAWSQSGVEYSDPVFYELEVESAMITIFLLLGMLGLSFGLSGLGYYFKKSPILIVASLLWMGSGAWAFTQSAEMWDGYFFIGCVGILMGIVSAFAPWLWGQQMKNRSLTDEEIDEQYRLDMEKARSRFPRRTRRLM